MRLTPVVFIGLVEHGTSIPSTQPLYAATRLTKAFMKRVRTISNLCVEHSLSSIEVDNLRPAIEIDDSAVVNMGLTDVRVVVHFLGDFMTLVIWARAQDGRGRPRPFEPIAESSAISLDDLEQIHAGDTPVACREWTNWDVCFEERYEDCVLEELRRSGTFKKYHRAGWIGAELAQMLAELSD